MVQERHSSSIQRLLNRHSTADGSTTLEVKDGGVAQVILKSPDGFLVTLSLSEVAYAPQGKCNLFSGRMFAQKANLTGVYNDQYMTWINSQGQKIGRPFVAFFINKNRISPQDIKVSGRGRFYATIKIMTLIEGREEEIVIYNVYNPNEKRGDVRYKEGWYEGLTTNSALPLLESALEKYHGQEQLVVGDFNIHYSKSDSENYRNYWNYPST
jgi:hypothetical protein